MLFVDTSIIHHSSEGVLILCNILDLLIYSYSDMFDCISDKSAEILNEYEEYELDTVFSAVNTEKVVISKIMNRVPSVKKKSLEMANITCSGNDIISFINCICSEIFAVSK